MQTSPGPTTNCNGHRGCLPGGGASGRPPGAWPVTGQGPHDDDDDDDDDDDGDDGDDDDDDGGGRGVHDDGGGDDDGNDDGSAGVPTPTNPPATHHTADPRPNPGVLEAWLVSWCPGMLLSTTHATSPLLCLLLHVVPYVFIICCCILFSAVCQSVLPELSCLASSGLVCLLPHVSSSEVWHANLGLSFPFLWHPVATSPTNNYHESPIGSSCLSIKLFTP